MVTKFKEMNKLTFTSFGQWQLDKLLGSGAFGEVYLWKNYETGYEIAIKSLKANPKLKPDEISILHKRWLQEYKWMQNLRTNYIVGAVHINDTNFVNYLTEHNNAELSLPVIIMDYCNGGDLRGHLKKINNLNGLIEAEVRHILYALLRATEYLHQECNIEHRDIKPENIVLHVKGDEKIYKLTDFGYAREIPENTIAQSVVGTRNYVAPEVIDPGIYTKTVDYWSIGVLAYEIICGVHPFIPHQTFVNRMKNIQRKSSQCIAIIQNIDDLTLDRFEFINNILQQNRMSCIFIKEIEKWLRLALDTNYKTRGCDNNNELKFYSEMDAILRKKVVTVFSLKTLKKYYYDIECYESLQNFHNKICSDNQIDIRNIFFIFPPLHPKKLVQTPVDYFVPEWCDTSNPDNPPVMLFVTEFFIQSRCDIKIEKYFVINETIRKCMSVTESDNLPLWLLEQFERDVHFILNEHQHILECYLMGLHNFAIEIEHEAFKAKHVIDALTEKISQLSGSVKHSNVVLNECIRIYKEEPAKSAKETAKMFTKQCQEWEKSIVPNLKATYKEILQKCRDLATDHIYEQYAKKDIFGLSKYRKLFSLNYTTSERLENAQIAFDKCINEFIKFTRCSEMIKIRDCMLEQIRNFGFVRQKFYGLEEIIFRFENDLENFTRSLVRSITNDKLSSSMNSLHIDEPTSTGLINNHCLVNDFDMDSKALINECQTLCNAMEMSLDMD